MNINQSGLVALTRVSGFTVGLTFGETGRDSLLVFWFHLILLVVLMCVMFYRYITGHPETVKPENIIWRDSSYSLSQKSFKR